MAFNKVTLLGNLTADPEQRTTPSGRSVTSFTVAVNRSWKGADGQRQEETSFIPCTAWGPTGETIARYFTKGRQILVSGRLQQRRWEDKETGKNRSAIDVVVDEFSFISDGRGGATAGSTAPAGASPYGGGNAGGDAGPADTAPVDDIDEPIDLSDIPF